MLCNRLHKFENVLPQVVTLEIWNSTFKNIGNELHAHGNRLLLCKSVLKLFWASGNRLLLSGNRLPESKNSGKRFFFEKFFWKNCAIQSFLWKILFILILRFLHILSLLLNLLDFFNLFECIFDSWNLLESWFLTWVFGIIKISLEALLLQKTPAALSTLITRLAHGLDADALPDSSFTLSALKLCLAMDARLAYWWAKLNCHFWHFMT